MTPTPKNMTPTPKNIKFDRYRKAICIKNPGAHYSVRRHKTNKRANPVFKQFRIYNVYIYSKYLVKIYDHKKLGIVFKAKVFYKYFRLLPQGRISIKSEDKIWMKPAFGSEMTDGATKNKFIRNIEYGYDRTS